MTIDRTPFLNDGSDVSAARAELLKLVDLTNSGSEKNENLRKEFTDQLGVVRSEAFSQWSSGMFVLNSPVRIVGARRVGAYPYSDATLLSDSMRDSKKLPAHEWSNDAGAIIAKGNPDAYVAATSHVESVGVSHAPVGGGDPQPCFWDLPVSTNKLLPNVMRFGINNGYSIGSKIPALIIKAGVGFTPHALRMGFVDVVMGRYGSGLGYYTGSYPKANYKKPFFAAKNIAVKGVNYGNGNYISTLVIPLSTYSAMEFLRVVNNGHVPIDIHSYGLVWMNKRKES